ncbi:hypothetical protein [Nostoc sp. MS1]|uniref:hypothetical protein n=1 Tax=Nostoc sp. MS1 TaxID=2764711 RepID=UPI001CC74151|nr:hypothetical protein [Nostoc sp. MS1]
MWQLPLKLKIQAIRGENVKNQELLTSQDSCKLKLSGMVTLMYDHSPDCLAGAWKQRLINSFIQPRFRNVLARTTVLRRVSWFWHCPGVTQLCSDVIAIIADGTNDYRQILIKYNHLANTLQDLDPSNAFLLVIANGQSRSLMQPSSREH